MIVATEEGLARIPRAVREGSLALGATKAETLWRTVLPIASPAMMTGLILAVVGLLGLGVWYVTRTPETPTPPTTGTGTGTTGGRARGNSRVLGGAAARWHQDGERHNDRCGERT